MGTGMSYRPLADMHNDGVYFAEEISLVRDESLLCNYSGLPSVKSYEVEIEVEEIVMGHS